MFFTHVCHSVHGGVGFQACTGRERGLAYQHALGRGRGWLTSMHWGGGAGLVSQHALGKTGGMYPTGMLSCFDNLLLVMITGVEGTEK